MTFVATGITAGAGLITKGIGAGISRKKRKDAEEENKKIEKKQKAALDKEVKAKQLKQMDKSRELKGQAAIDPNTQYARNENERAVSSMVSQINKSGGSESEKLNMASKALSAGQRRTQGIEAAASDRRGKLNLASLDAEEDAANTGLMGAQGKLAIEDKTRNQTMQEMMAINAGVGQTTDSISNMITDLGSIAMYTQGMGDVSNGGKGFQLDTDMLGGAAFMKSPVYNVGKSFNSRTNARKIKQ